eukprot:1137943-Pelagomonas_calceolata.AAC.3
MRRKSTRNPTTDVTPSTPASKRQRHSHPSAPSSSRGDPPASSSAPRTFVLGSLHSPFEW